MSYRTSFTHMDVLSAPLSSYNVSIGTWLGETPMKPQAVFAAIKLMASFRRVVKLYGLILVCTPFLNVGRRRRSYLAGLVAVT